MHREQLNSNSCRKPIIKRQYPSWVDNAVDNSRSRFHFRHCELTHLWEAKLFNRLCHTIRFWFRGLQHGCNNRRCLTWCYNRHQSSDKNRGWFISDRNQSYSCRCTPYRKVNINRLSDHMQLRLFVNNTGELDKLGQ